VTMKGYVLTVQREMAAPPEAIFDILADVSRHHLIDGSGMLGGPTPPPRSASPWGRPSAWG